jgi:hypothetical protein
MPAVAVDGVLRAVEVGLTAAVRVMLMKLSPCTASCPT